MELTVGAQLSERRGRGGRLGRRWMGRRGTVFGLRGGAASGLAGPEAEWAARSVGPKSRKIISELKIGFLNLPRLWNFVEGDFGGILT
jgi:hypothetical protein